MIFILSKKKDPKGPYFYRNLYDNYFSKVKLPEHALITESSAQITLYW